MMHLLSLSVVVLFGASSFAQNQSVDAQRPTMKTFGTAKARAAGVRSGVATQNTSVRKSPRVTRSSHPSVAPQHNSERVSQDLAPRAQVRQIVSFPSANTDSAVQALKAELKTATSGVVALATKNEFAKHKNSICNQQPCALVTDSELGLIQAARNSGYLKFDFSVIGKREVRFPQFDLNQRKNRSAAKGTGATPAAGNTLWTVYNPDTFLYYIPDLGYQELGDYLPLATANILTWSAVVEGVDYEVGFWHSSPSDVEMKIGYDDTGIGGTTNVEDPAFIFNHNTVPSGYNTIIGSTNYFDGLHPDSYYYVGAWDTVFQDDGYLDYVQFDVYWADLSDLTIDASAGSYTEYTAINDFIDVHSTVLNDTDVDTANGTDVAWYATPMPFSNNCLDITNFDPTYPDNYFIGYNTIPASFMTAGASVNASLSQVDLWNVVNDQNQYMIPGLYCVWAYADDLAQEDENYEDNNAYILDHTLSNDLAFQYQGPVSVQTVGTGSFGKVYPNPVVDTLRIDLNERVQAAKVQVQVTSMNGQVVNAFEANGTQTISVDFSQLPSGVYLVNVTSQGNRPAQFKIVK